MRTSEGYRVGIIGASGPVGLNTIDILSERRYPMNEIRAYASADSVGKTISAGGMELECLPLEDQTIEGLDLAFICTPASVSEHWAPRLNFLGAAVIDKSSQWRSTKPLIVPEVNPEALDDFTGIVSSPNCSTIQAVLPVNAIKKVAGLYRLKVHTFQAVSGSGKRGPEELKLQTRAILDNDNEPAPNLYPRRIAFNMLPQAGEALADNRFDEEEKIVNETIKILGPSPSFWIGAACSRVPVLNSHSERLEITTTKNISTQQCREILEKAEGIRVVDPYPTAIDADGQDDVLVGLIRYDKSMPRTLEMWTVADNTRKGAGTNAVQIAELMIAKGIL